ncbi:hypothetical protein [Kitasatospora cineracea]|uniref:Uncharacterized protein n=1 Tax=Kitasatospora cineracea TaxID=88074 RepID=A0A3N4RIF5_9ACTN|nr:hypothetical protein [Kitasatospora cineracea]RPE33172.1 hypothetical protein EDD38_1451 [Kitasatospora cineracea]
MHQRVQARHLWDRPFLAELVAVMAAEAEQALAADGYQRNDKRDASVGAAAHRFATQVNLAAIVARSTGLDVEQPHVGIGLGFRVRDRERRVLTNLPPVPA